MIGHTNKPKYKPLTRVNTNMKTFKTPHIPSLASMDMGNVQKHKNCNITSPQTFKVQCNKWESLA
jgi:hypothetical protein